ncbi:hypothetical protein DFJ73DRAFT_176146 [Zopfochytrium polystomum]|nr:hypothetical protein DFJ73DRAFT_176146 [Zopfochytrium polystomum]
MTIFANLAGASDVSVRNKIEELLNSIEAVASNRTLPLESLIEPATAILQDLLRLCNIEASTAILQMFVDLLPSETCRKQLAEVQDARASEPFLAVFHEFLTINSLNQSKSGTPVESGVFVAAELFYRVVKGCLWDAEPDVLLRFVQTYPADRTFQQIDTQVADAVSASCMDLLLCVVKGEQAFRALFLDSKSTSLYEKLCRFLSNHHGLDVAKFAVIRVLSFVIARYAFLLTQTKPFDKSSEKIFLFWHAYVEKNLFSPSLRPSRIAAASPGDESCMRLVNDTTRLVHTLCVKVPSITLSHTTGSLFRMTVLRLQQMQHHFVEIADELTDLSRLFGDAA